MCLRVKWWHFHLVSECRLYLNVAEDLIIHWMLYPSSGGGLLLWERFLNGLILMRLSCGYYSVNCLQMVNSIWCVCRKWEWSSVMVWKISLHVMQKHTLDGFIMTELLLLGPAADGCSTLNFVVPMLKFILYFWWYNI